MSPIPKRISPKQQQSINKRWGKITESLEPDEAKAVEDYLSLSVEDLSKRSLPELQRFNELEKLVLARIRRGREENTLIEVERAADIIEQILSIMINVLESLPVRCGALVAAEPEAFECQQILEKEINFMRRQAVESMKNLKVELSNG